MVLGGMQSAAGDSPAVPAASGGSGQPDIRAILAQAQAIIGSGQAATDTTPKVFWGREYNGSSLQTSILTADEAYNRFSSLSPEEVNALGQRMQRIGMISDGSNLQQILSGWEKAVSIAATYYAGGKEISPWQVLDMQEGLALANPAAGGGGYTGPHKRTVRSKSFEIPTAAEADEVTRTMYQNLLGRDPTDAELGRYRSLLIAKAKQNPTNVTQNITYDSYGSPINTTSITTGGFTGAMAQSAVRDKAQADPEYGAYQAATTYMNALMQAIGL